MAENKVDIDLVVRQLRSKSTAPLLEEGLAARVGGEIRSRSPSTEGTHSEDQAVLSCLQDGSNNLCNLQGSQAVDSDNVLKLVARRLKERNWHAVALSDVVDQDSDVKSLDELAESFVIGIVILREIHSEHLGLNALSGVFLGNFDGQSIEFRLRSGDEDEVEAFGSKLKCVFLAQTIGCAGDNSPRAGLTILSKL